MAGKCLDIIEINDSMELAFDIVLKDSFSPEILFKFTKGSGQLSSFCAKA